MSLSAPQSSHLVTTNSPIFSNFASPPQNGQGFNLISLIFLHLLNSYINARNIRPELLHDCAVNLLIVFPIPQLGHDVEQCLAQIVHIWLVGIRFTIRMLGFQWEAPLYYQLYCAGVWLFWNVLPQVGGKLGFCFSVPTFVKSMNAALINRVPLLLMGTGWRFHRHEQFCHIFYLHFWFFRFAFVNVRRQGLQECRAFALLFLVVIDVNVATATSIYLYIHCCRNFCRSIILLFQQV
nr:MAG TPA: hypothetical protein [Caudoviricetes sp.]